MADIAGLGILLHLLMMNLWSSCISTFRVAFHSMVGLFQTLRCLWIRESQSIISQALGDYGRVCFAKPKTYLRCIKIEIRFAISRGTNPYYFRIMICTTHLLEITKVRSTGKYRMHSSMM